MIADKTVLAIIPARGGSKGLPGKNIYPLLGKPLIGYTIEAALQSQFIDKVIVSSDDTAIIEIARQYGCEAPFTRPPSLSTDDSSVIDVIVHVLGQLPGFDYVILLQPTSPLRNTADIDACIRKCHTSQSPVVTVTMIDKSPYWMYQLNDKNQMTPLLGNQDLRARQQLPSTYLLNGAVYVSLVDEFILSKSFIANHTIAQVMPKRRSVDIDSIEDMRMAEVYLKSPES